MFLNKKKLWVIWGTLHMVSEKRLQHLDLKWGQTNFLAHILLFM